MAWSLGHTLIVVLALLLGLAAGWLLHANQPPKTSPTKPTEPSALSAPEPTSAPEPASVPEPISAAAEVEPVSTSPTIPAQRSAESVPDQPMETEETRVAVAEPEPVPATEAAGEAAPAVATGDADAAAPVIEVADSDEPTPAPALATNDEDTRADGHREETPVPTAETEPAEAETEVKVEAEAETDDDLRQIQGIGPKLASTLQAAGIRTYRQLAGTEVEELRTVVRAAGIRLPASLPTWPRQARLLINDGTEQASVVPGPATDATGS